MTSKNLLVLAVALLMFPQLAQTLYSPALGDIGQAFAVGPERAGQTLSVYFLAFALGVVVWGRLCDRWGRRPVMLAGLGLYVAATLLALSVSTFNGLLLAQAIAAFGAAVGSVATQTLLRDRFHGAQLGQVFSVMGIALAASPALGLFSGATLVQYAGYRGMLAGLLVMAAVLWAACVWALPETRPASLPTSPLGQTVGLMLRDAEVWRSVGLVAAFNIALFGYYSVGPFIFTRLGLSAAEFGYSGVLLALGSGLGAWLNKALLKRGLNGEQLVLAAAGVALLGGLSVLLLQDSWLFVWPMLLVVLAFGMAIPNVLGAALVAYQDRLGTAAAVFGLLYYLVIGAGLTVVAWAQDLGWSLLTCGLAALWLAAPRVFRS
ncbi:MFS transporter [Pseudomonas lurida]|jgi:predicted MFS family arabinose efflux permease|uniref:Inner membrane transport protein YdhC n=1 Tax=Pseudomonas fluorescens TaxID=294 RepID=A0A5E6MUP3_PSEFL|nr:MFS transporter [Pseudomonas lurida]VVM15138.1 Inner membrane transport protein YdhC [Pseudomonas fluorescens]MCF5027669.1 MFS transporter [Pseudomonas lurida]MCF5310767.1 MFS transporter [Pseudomonas lurida]MCF5326734.1 MFS transporter [Pseudomonas lurida]VVN03313.1 Inner membrane transport protein YdhC [Pseudomonas fluorescens]